MGWPWPHLIKMRHWKMISKLSICQSAMYGSGGGAVAADPQLGKGLNALEEARGSGPQTA